MSELLDREAVIDQLHQSINLFEAEDRIRELKPVTRQTGKWINDKNDIPICDKCGYIPPYNHAIDDYEYSNFCPNCGAKMVEPQERSE